MTNPLNITYVDLQGPPVNAAWLNAVGRIVSGTSTPTTITATAGQTVFTISTGQSNFVFVDGVFQIPGSAYTWTGDTEITFTSGIHLGGLVTVL